MKVLLKNWKSYKKTTERRLLTEVSLAQAKKSLTSKRTLGMIKGWMYYKKIDPRLLQGYQTKLQLWANRQIPNDITDNQQGLSLLWLLKNLKEDPDALGHVLSGDPSSWDNYSFLRPDLETFFQNQRFMPQKEIMKITSFEDFNNMVRSTHDAIDAHLRSKSYTDVDKGAMFLAGGFELDGNGNTVTDERTGRLRLTPEHTGWVIAVIHNKGAACELGKQTRWCTADPSTNYFETYYKPGDPLFIVENHNYDPPQRYQVHYG